MTLHWIHLKKETTIYEQLLIEEALLRYDDRNFCIVSEGSQKSIVMGISGKVEELVDTNKAQALNLPILRRFSGGGTVVVDESTLFVTFIFQKNAHSFAPFPEKIMQWTEKIYAHVFDPHPFLLKENDYVLEGRKCGGNAQYIKKERFLHHTSFLWDFCDEHMSALLHPKKTPSYRGGRSHSDFLCKLNTIFPYKTFLFEKLLQVLSQHYQIIPLEQDHLQCPPEAKVSTTIINFR